MSDINIHKIVKGVALNVKYADVDSDTDLWFKCIVIKVNGYGNNDDGHYIDVDVEFEDGEQVNNECLYEHLYSVDSKNGWHLVEDEQECNEEPSEEIDDVPITTIAHEISDDDEESESDDTSVDIRPSLGAFERGFNIETDDMPNSIKVTLAICMGAFAGIVSVAAYGFYQQYISCQA